METFSEMPYQRPDLDAVKEETRQYICRLKQAASFEEMNQLYLSHKQGAEGWRTMASLAHIRNTIDTNDAFYEEEIRYFNQKQPEVRLLEMEAEKVILESPYCASFAAEYGDFFVKNMEIEQKLSDESIIPDLVEESNLAQEYSKVSAAAMTEFRGESCNFYGLLKHMQSTNREERREAMMAWGDLYEQISGKLDDIYDRMVPLRDGIAKKLGFSSYIDFIYLQRGRYDYTAADVAAFRKQVREVIVPVCQRLRDEQARRLGVEKLHYYDESLLYPEGNAVPRGNRDELVAKAQEMYRQISPETGEYFDFMVEHDLFDLETKPGKRGGGYCTFLPAYKAPFIFSNFNGTSADVDVLTHEAGHAFEAYTASRNLPLTEMVFPTSEVAEIHSMSMEHFCYPYMESFFGDKADEYRYGHLMDALVSIPYMAAVDEFQHRVFETPQLTAQERRRIWHELEETYMPWRDYDGHRFLEDGGFWMQKQHIFLYPFYYIDYALAQICAFEFYGRAKKNWQECWADYYRLCQAGGSKGYFDLLKLAHLSNPFQEGAVRKIVDSLLEDLF